MKTKNICKFVPVSSQGYLETHSFIYETEKAAIEMHTVLKYNRILLVKNGTLHFRINNMNFVANTGCLIFAFSRESFDALAKNDAEYLYIDFGGTRSDVLFRRFGINAVNRFFCGFDGMIPFWYDCLTRASRENIDLAAESVLIYSLSRLNTTPNKENNIIQQIIDITEESFNLSELSISMISNELSYNTKYLSHLFKQKMGIGYTEYLRNFRIKYAIMLLDNGINSVKNIASLCGYSNPLYFSAVFKHTIGVSPSQYKNKK